MSHGPHNNLFCRACVLQSTASKVLRQLPELYQNVKPLSLKSNFLIDFSENVLAALK